tara:strand:- start:464 stop:565 length:102 start_codon:yes stop_codon:yes gene_type:complete
MNQKPQPPSGLESLATIAAWVVFLYGLSILSRV